MVKVNAPRRQTVSSVGKDRWVYLGDGSPAEPTQDRGQGWQPVTSVPLQRATLLSSHPRVDRCWACDLL